MATNGVIRNDFKTGHAVQISWTVNSQNVANNTSNVTVLAQLVSTSSSYTISSTATKNGSLTINGTTYNFTFSASLSGNQTKTVFTKTLDIPHNSDGTKTCSMATTLGINVTLSGTYYGNVSASGSGVFNNIPRTSSMSLSHTGIEAGNTITVTINRNSTNFTHKVYYSFGSYSATISTTATTSTSYAIPLSHIAAIPNTTSGTATISVDTYNGSTYIGSVSANFTIWVPNSVLPTFSSLSSTVVASGAATSYGYVQGMSKSTLVINGASGTYGSSITAYSITGGGFTGTTASYTTGVLYTSGNITFTAKVQDSRGRWSVAKNLVITVSAYSKPSITSYSATRCLSTGILNDDGTYVKALSNFTYSTVLGLNTLSSKVKYRKTGTITWSTEIAIASGATGVVVGGGLIDVSSTYEVAITLVDKFNTVTQTVMVSTAFVTLDFKMGGKGIAIGKAAETDNLFDIAMNVKITGDTTIGDRLNLNNKSRLDATGGALRLYTSAFGSNDYGLRLDPTGPMELWVNSACVFSVSSVGNMWGKGLTLNTGSASGSTGIMIYGSATSCNIWCGSGGAVLQTLGSANLHLGQNNTTDMIFYYDRIETTKIFKATSKIAIDAPIKQVNHSQFSVDTSSDANGHGDGVTHMGYWSGTGYNHYFRGKGTFNINSTGGVYSSTTIYAPAFTPSSDRDAKYDITEYDTSTLYDYVKNLSVYAYRYRITDRQYEGEERIQDMWLGSMVQELPFEVVNYDTTPNGNGKAVNTYSFATMIGGATKELIGKTERLEDSDYDKQERINKLEVKMQELEGKLNGVI